MQACGLKSLTASYEADLQSDVLTVHDEAASDDALTCAAKAIDGSDYLMFFEADYLAARFNEVDMRLRKPRALANSKNWLAERGLLSKVPDFATSDMSDIVFARKVESICGAAATGALGENANPHQFNYDFLLEAQNDAGKRAAFECIMHVTVVAGFEIGFIGNEAVRND